MTTRSSILESADHVFGRVGYDAATTREIAELSGVNKALIHYHFKSKRDLFDAVLAGYYEKLDRTLLEAMSAGCTAADRMGRALDAYVDFLAANRSFARMVQREASGGQHLGTIVSRTLPIFERGMDLLRGEYPAARSGDLAAPQLLVSFYGMAISYFTYGPVLEELLGNDPLSPRSLALRKRHLRRMLDLVAGALEAEPQRDRCKERRGPGTRRRAKP